MEGIKIKNGRFQILVLILCLASAFQSCNFNNVVNEKIDIPDYVWKSDFVLSYELRIPETDKYSISYDVRYGVQYPYRNVYISYELLDSTGEAIDEGLQNLTLFEEKTGKPLGDGLGDIFDYNFLAFEELEMDQGLYTLKIHHLMREEELPFVMSFGIQVRKAEIVQ